MYVRYFYTLPILLQIIFDYPHEILTHITGTFVPAMGMGPNVIKSLSFHTTKKKHGPYGEEQGTPFNTKLKEGKIVGIHGRTGLFLDAIGVHAIEGKIMVETTETSPPLALTNSPHIAITEITPKEPAGAITEIDHPHWSSKLVCTNKGPVEEVSASNPKLIEGGVRLLVMQVIMFFFFWAGCLWGDKRTGPMWTGALGWRGRKSMG